MRCRSVLLVAAVAATVGACGSSTSPRSALEGAWLATLSGQSLLSLHLTVSGTSVTGTGGLGNVSSLTPLPLTVSGQFVAPDATLSITGSLGTMTFVGALGSAGLVGVLNGAGYVHTNVTFTRH
jgi:hypothetical protein